MSVLGFSFLFSYLGSWRPTYWNDEIATLRAARLPLTTLGDFVGEKDVVHALYYLLAGVWIDLGGESESFTRLSSSIAVSLASLGVAVLVAQHSTRLAVVSALVFAVLPRVTLSGTEFRSGALVTACAVWSTVALIRAIRGRSPWVWGVYAALVTFGVILFVYFALLVVAHGVFVAFRARAHLARWLVAAVIAAAASSPIALEAVTQRDQIAWIETSAGLNPWTLVVSPTADTNWAFGIVLVVVIAGGIWANRRRFRAPTDLTLLCGLGVVVPSALLALADLVAGPLFSPHYLAMTAPFVAILVVAAARSLVPDTRVLGAAIVVIALALSLPSWASQRTVTPRPASIDFRAVATAVSTVAVPGEAVYLDATGRIPTRPRLALAAYPDAFAGLRDVALITDFDETGTFSDRVAPLSVVLTTLAPGESMIVVTRSGYDWPREGYAVRSLSESSGWRVWRVVRDQA